MNVITVIGNGFDLQLGLKTRYADFFEWLKNEVDPNGYLDYTGSSEKFKSEEYVDNDKKLLIAFKEFISNEKEEFIRRINSTNVNNWWVWYFLSLNKIFNCWADVEKEIQDLLSVTEKDKVRYDLLNYHYNRKNSYFYDFDKIISDLAESTDAYTEIKQYESFCGDMFDAIYRNKNFNRNILNDEKTFNFKIHSQNLLNHLKSFEGKFRYYINKNITSEYIINSGRLLNTILMYPYSKEGLDCYIKNAHFTLLNFNYTKPMSRFALNSINVHGSIEKKETIFGIDENSILPDGAEIFKKTYRKLFFTEVQSYLPETCEYLLVFGHSLAEADYAYFKILFNLYDIYDSETTLIFFVNDQPRDDNSKKTKEDIPEKIDKIYKLIHTYGKENFGVQKGGDLLHKMQLENRIQVVKISELLSAPIPAYISSDGYEFAPAADDFYPSAKYAVRQTAGLGG